jgi:hypothetical protein
MIKQHLFEVLLFPVGRVFPIKCLSQNLSGGWFIDGLTGPAGLM